MTIGFITGTSTTAISRASRNLEPAEWTGAGAPLPASPRDVVKDLHSRHLPAPSTAVVAVYDPDGRIRASASFAGRPGVSDGWERRNALLSHLRRVIPHDLRLRQPVRTAVLMLCRDGEAGWTEEDGAWMWGLRDACTLHGLRCGSYVTLTRAGWNIIGENRSGRTPNAASWSRRPGGAAPAVPGGGPQPLRRAAVQ
ncbi:hypothetical protein [Actinacidiphila sp. ITFR-21]|uniref:hypothetical protein n=1 Tax=Actinacidiphila sp. ITFR-21 TaxID=3075199 RepID=UPI00288AAC8D|nr:hypothetical protein [Streptomyces sp. ITFR-21]WNI18403.1 hypothetical protein RLT57_24620 [Streptomyces sp. ITFR-21]